MLQGQKCFFSISILFLFYFILFLFFFSFHLLKKTLIISRETFSNGVSLSPPPPSPSKKEKGKKKNAKNKKNKKEKKRDEFIHFIRSHHRLGLESTRSVELYASNSANRQTLHSDRRSHKKRQRFLFLPDVKAAHT